LCLSSKGRVFSFGWGEVGQLGHGDNEGQQTPKVIKSLLQVVVKDIACGSRHSLIQTVNNEIFAFGYGKFGSNGDSSFGNRNEPTQVQFPSKQSFQAISASFWTSLAY